MATSAVPTLDLNDRQFDRISTITYRVSGLVLQAGKQGLVQSRLARRVRELGLPGFDAYLDQVEGDRDGRELMQMVDLLTTNKTAFFRELPHFDYLRDRVLPNLLGARLRIWSAACSSGEEPYTIAMVLRETLPGLERMDARILATDISARVLAKARQGVYVKDVVDDVPPALVRRYFTASPPGYRVADSLRSLVTFGRLNLMGDWPMRGPFDVIFCRNVMIYFDKPTQERLVDRFWELLPAGGQLLVGHSESLSPLSHRFTYVQPAVYVK